MKSDVFISYKSEEYSYADKVRSALEESGVACWMAPESIRGGSSYAAEIPKAIRECRVFVLILTPKSQESQWVKREIDRAINEHKLVIPFMPEEMTFNDDITFYLTNVQQFFAYRDWDRELNRMIDNVCEELGIERIIPAPPVPEDPVQEAVAADSDPPAGMVVSCREKPVPVPKPKRVDAVEVKPSAGRKKRVLIAVIAAVVLAAAVIAGILIFGGTDPGTICGEKVDLSADKLTLSEVTVTSADLEKIAGMTSLTELTLENCTFSGFSNLGTLNCAQLTKLTISGCELSDEQLATLAFGDAQLQELNLSGNAISDLTPLANMADKDSLTSLDLSGNHLTNIQLLEGFTQLRSVSVSDNQLASLKGLENNLYLETFRARNNALTTITGLGNATLLTEVNLSGNYLRDISDLAPTVASIEKIYLSENKLTDISVLQNAKNLRYADISDNAISDLTPLTKKRRLVGLDASGNKLKSVEYTALPTLVSSFSTDDNDDPNYHLEYLDLSDNQITDLSIRAMSCPLEVINLAGNPLTGEATISSTQDVSYLNLCGCTPEDIHLLLYGLTIYNLIINYDESIEQNGKTVSNKLIMIDCPPVKQVSVNDAYGGKVQFLTLTEYKDQKDSMSASAVTEQEHIAKLMQLTEGV